VKGGYRTLRTFHATSQDIWGTSYCGKKVERKWGGLSFREKEKREVRGKQYKTLGRKVLTTQEKNVAHGRTL